MTEINPDEIREEVRKNYAGVANNSGAGCGCTSESCCDGASPDVADLAARMGYLKNELGDVPDGANMGLGCGNPLAIASLKPGEAVLDLGSGGGLDCFLAAKRVGSSGRVIGVDMTPEMVAKARENARKGGFENVEFRLGEIEHLPVADGSIDVILSNCVINLSPDKPAVFQETYRVLRAGGRLSISDVAAVSEMPDEIKQDFGLIAGCVAGAATVDDIVSMLENAGFESVRVTPKPDSRELIKGWFPGRGIEEFVVSVTIEGVKPTS